MESIELRHNWADVTLGEVVHLSTERLEPSDVPMMPYLSLEHLESQTHRIVGRGLAGDVSSTKSYFQAGDVLYGRLRPNLNKVAIPDFDGVCSTDILVFRPSPALLNRFLLQLLSDRSFVSYASRHAQGVNLPRVSTRSVQAYRISLPPIEEQSRIVDAVDGFSAPIEQTRDRLVKAKRLLADFPKSLARDAVSGELTNSWRVERGGRGQSPQIIHSPITSTSPSIPPDWSWVSVEEAGQVQLGRQRSPEHHAGEHMRPYLRVANVLEDRIDIGDVMSMNFSPTEFETYRLRYGDILLNEGQSHELVGRPAMFRDELPGACFTNTLIRFRASEFVRAEYALLVFRSYLHSGTFQAIAKITTNLAHLGAKRFASLPFPLPPLSEQDEIVRLGKISLVSVAAVQSMLMSLNENLAELSQSTLSSGLTGKLQTHNNSDESASSLIQRLGNWKVTSSSPRRSGRLGIGAKTRRPKLRDIRSVVQALADTHRSVSSQDLFAMCGYPADAGSEQVEHFFLALRQALEAGQIRKSRIEDEDFFEFVGGDQ